MPYKYIGRKTDFCGKPLWEIVGNLKNFGVGRIVKRQMFERYPEPSFFKILEVKADPQNEPRKVRVLAEQTFRGRYIGNISLHRTSYKADYQLIPKDEESTYCDCSKVKLPEQRVFPRAVPFPPLLKELILRDMRSKDEDVTEEPKCPLIVASGIYNVKYRVANEGETPNFDFKVGFGETVSPNLYEGINLETDMK